MNMGFLLILVVILWITWGAFAFIQCGKIGKTAAEHEQDVLGICLTVERSDMIDCIKREWDRIHEENK